MFTFPILRKYIRAELTYSSISVLISIAASETYMFEMVISVLIPNLLLGVEIKIKQLVL